MKIVSFANPISCQLNPTLRNIRKFTQNDGEGKELGGRERWTVKSRGKRKKKRKRAKGSDRKKVKGWRDRNGNWVQLKFCCSSPSKRGLAMVHSVLPQWEQDNEFKPLLHLTPLPDALAPPQLKSHTLNLPYI